MKLGYALISFFICFNVYAQPQFLKGDFPIDNDLDYQTFDITVCDLDGDGDLDLVTARIDDFISEEVEGGFRWYENINNDFFELRYIDTSVAYSNAITYGDADGDGDMDLFAGKNLGDVYLFVNDGNENFTRIELDSIELMELEALDLDQDGDMDLLGRSSNNTDLGAVFWYENDGNQSYTRSLVDSVFKLSDMECVDVDSDGFLDIVVASNNPSAFQWYKNDGSENFTAFNIVDSTYEITGISVSDFDQDGDQDMVVASFPDNDIVWYENDGSENFSLNTFPSTDDAHTVQCTDMDGDGDIDLLVSNENTVKWYENDGAQNFTQQYIDYCNPSAYTYTGYFRHGVPPFVVDFEGDGDMDVFAIDRRNNTVKLFTNYGNDNFDIQLVYGQDSYLSGIEFMDFDSDGDSDIMATSNHHLLWMESFGDKQYAYHIVTDNDCYFNSVIDMDGDNDLDFVYTQKSYLKWAENVNNEYYEKHEIDYYYNANGGKPLLQDLDQDGDIDIVCLTIGGSGISWYENDGSQNFTESQLINETTNKIVVEDLDQDGDFDIIAGSGFTDDDVFWFKNDGSANFTYFTINDSIDDPKKLIVLDMDADGDLDILSQEVGGDEIIHLINDGIENFTRTVIFDGFGEIGNFIAADFDQNNSIDILVQTDLTNNPDLLFLKNDGNQNFSSEVIWDNIGFTNNVNLIATDVDMDSDMDVFFYLYGFVFGAYLFENIEVNDFLHMQIHPFVDPNSNGSMDSAEYAFYVGNASVEPAADYQFLHEDNIELYLTSGQDYQLSLNLDSTIWEGTDSLHRAFLTVDSSLYVDTNLYIGVQAIHSRLYSTDITGNWPRCGSTIQHTLTVQNQGTELDSVYLDYELPSAIQFVSSVPAPVQINGQMLSYDLGGILTAQNQDIKLNITLPIAIDSIEYELELRVDTGQLVLMNSDSFTQIIRCSYDPNDKQVSPYYGEEGYVLSGQELEYLIRFQNTGNDTAFVVVVKDDLDLNLDIQSFTLVSNSHPVTVKQDFENHRLEFRFEDINLTDTVTNESASHGFVKFKIKVLDSLSVGDQIENTASIYFDENDPIITNTTENNLYDCNFLGANILSTDTVFMGWNNLFISLEDEYIESASWRIGGTEVATSIDGYSPIFTMAGVQSLQLHLKNALCEKDTILYFTVIDNIGLTENGYGESIQIYPNPTSGGVFIEYLGEFTEVKWRISNNLGQQMLSGTYTDLKKVQLNIPGEAGLYFLELKFGNEGAKRYKILKN